LKSTISIPDLSELLRSIEEVRLQCNQHEKKIFCLEQSNNQLKEENKELKQANKKLELENKKIRLENQNLKAQVSSLKHKKDSSNSSMPPSSDMRNPNRKQSLRKSSGKKPGGQPGHKGTTLKMTETPDLFEDHMPTICEQCGTSLLDIPADLAGRRQVIDLPPIQPMVTEHRVFSKQCTCGHCTKTQFPAQIKTPVSYGANIQSLVTYLSARQFLPVDRMHEFLKDVFNVRISQGGICYLLDKMAKKAQSCYREIKNSVMQSGVIGADETGANIDGVNHWYWTLQNPKHTFIGVHRRRGFEAIVDLFGNAFQDATLVTDCWASYFKTNAKDHQICIAHLQRELVGLTEKYPAQNWTIKFNALLLEPIQLAKKDTPVSQKDIETILTQFEKLLYNKPNPKWEELVPFHKRIVKYRNYLFNFLLDPMIPPDNNASERAIRNVKVKQKVSGFFKSMKGAENYAIFRTCIDTALKQGGNPLAKLNAIASL
jgi:transposase/regulator of replication initiation timing